MWPLVGALAKGIGTAAVKKGVGGALAKVAAAGKGAGALAKIGKGINKGLDFTAGVIKEAKDSGILGGMGRSPERSDPSFMESLKGLKIDRGFYGHSKVPGMKQDKSKFAKL